MKKNSLADAPLDDEDIRQLFSAQSVNTPEELSRSLLSQAQEENVGNRKNNPNRSGSYQAWAPGFAVAATLFIAVIIAPSLLEEPESMLNNHEQAGSDMTTLSSSDAAAVAAPETTVPIVQNAPVSQARQSITMTKEALLMSNTTPSPAYRQSAEKWINEIQVLISDGQEQKAREEYRLLEQQYPGEAARYKPDFSRRSLDDTSPDDDTSPQ